MADFTFIDLVLTMACCFMVLFLLHIIVLSVQGGARIEAGLRAGEDYAMSGRPRPAQDPAKLDRANRWEAIVNNSMQSIPIGMALALLGLFCVSGYDHILAQAVMFIVFTFARVIYVPFYAYAMQPFRTIAWTLGVMAMFGIILNALISIGRIKDDTD